MMLLQYIQRLISDPTTSKADINDYKGVHKTLAAYLGASADVDILVLSQPQWIDSYYDFLVNDYRSNKQRGRDDADSSVNIANRYVKQLRKLINHAIVDGAFPDIDIFSGTKIESLLARRKSLTVSPVSPRIRRLVFSQDTSLLHLCEPYLISLYCCGLEPDKLNTLRPEHFDIHTHCIYLPHLRAQVPYPEALFDRIYTYVTHTSGDTHIDTDRIADALLDEGYGLYRGHSVFTDWLSLAIESGVVGSIRRIISLRLTGDATATAADVRCLQGIVRIMAMRYLRGKKSWYVLRTVSQPGIMLAQKLLDGDRLYPDMFKWRHQDIYVPHLQPAVQTRRTRHPKIVDPSAVLRNVIFVNADSSEAETLDRSVPDAYVMGRVTPTGKEYETVPYREIYTLQLVLRSINSTEAQEALQSEDLRDTIGNQTFEKDDIVSVSVPGFEEYTAMVTGVRKDSTYDLEVESGHFKINLKNIPQGLIRKIG